MPFLCTFSLLILIVWRTHVLPFGVGDFEPDIDRTQQMAVEAQLPLRKCSWYSQTKLMLAEKLWFYTINIEN